MGEKSSFHISLPFLLPKSKPI